MEASSSKTDSSIRDPVKVRVVLYNSSGQVVLGRTRDGDCKWGLPGGAVEPNDQGLMAAAQREVAEETGARGCHSWQVLYTDEARRTCVCAARVGLDSKLDSSQDPDQEFSEIRFFTPDQVAEMGNSAWDDAKDYIEIFFKNKTNWVSACKK